MTEEMPTYIGCKMIKAKPMTLGEYRGYRGLDMGKDESTGTEGYLVEYPDSNSNHENHEGYVSWSPREVFESAYLKLSDPTKITPDLVEDFVHTVEVSKDGNHTVCHGYAINGMSFIESSACVDPKKYDENTGREIACRKMADRSIWPGLGFVLAWAKNGINNK